MLEEDLQQMERKPTVISEEILEQTVHNSMRDTLRFCLKYAKNEYVERLFPGLTVQTLDSYDFRNSKMKVYVLETADFSFLDRQLKNSDTSISGGFTQLPYSTTNGVGRIDLTEKPLMVVREMSLYIRDELLEKDLSLGN